MAPPDSSVTDGELHMTAPVPRTVTWRTAAEYAVAAVAAAVVGLLLGWWTGQLATQPSLAAVSAVFPLLIAGLVTLVLLGVALATWRRSILLATAVFIAGVYVGSQLETPNSWRSAPGTGAVGTRADPTASWSGAVTCEWRGVSTEIEQINGFNGDITDLIPFEGVLTVVLLAPSGDVNLRDKGYDIYVGAEGTPERVSSDARSGSVVVPTRSGEVVISWSCASGP
jgi:hypothetical protein